MSFRGVLLTCFLVVYMYWCQINAQNAADVYEDEYYEDDYEDDTLSTVEVAVDSSFSADPKTSQKLYGFHRNVGGGVAKISKLMANEDYLNDTVLMYDCVKKVDAHILALEPVEEEEEEDDIAKQVQDLREKMEEVSILAANIISGNDTSNTNGTDNSTATTGKRKEKPIKVSFREKQEMKMKERRERELLKELQRPKFRMGADCESLVCGSCKAVVEEFGRTVHAAVNDSSARYVEDVLTVGGGFCKSKGIALKYVDMVGDICTTFDQDALGYKEALIHAFEDVRDGNWDAVADWDSLNAKKKQVCVAVGACSAADFQFQSRAVLRVQEQWDDKCFVCQAFANDLEVKVQLSRHVTEGSIVPIVAQTCDRMELEPHYRNLCEPLVRGKLLDDIAWLAKVHGESIERKTKGEVRFPDKLCEEIDWCRPWIDPVKLREKQAQETMEAVFF